MLEIDGDAIAHYGLHLSDSPIGPRRVADAHAWFDEIGHGPGARKVVEAPQGIPSALMTQGMPVPTPVEGPAQEPQLARLVGLRLCHDLGGVVGTVGNALEMMDAVGSEAGALALEAATILRRRLLLWRALLGGQGEATLGALLDLVDGQLAGGRATADAATLDAGMQVAEPMVPVVLTALVLGGEALPRGGVVRLAGDPARELVLLPEGPRAAWPAPLLRVIAGRRPAEEPAGRDVMALWLGAVAAPAGVRLSLAMGAGDSAGPLLLTVAR